MGWLVHWFNIFLNDVILAIDFFLLIHSMNRNMDGRIEWEARWNMLKNTLHLIRFHDIILMNFTVDPC